MSASVTGEQFDTHEAVLDAIDVANNDPSWPAAGDASLSRAVARVREAGAVLRGRVAA